MRLLRLALKLLWRDGRSGELTLLLLALLIAVTSATTISLFADRLQRTLTLQAAEFLAGDLVLASSVAVDSGWLAKAGELGLQQSQTTEFSSMLLENEQLLLASIKAVSANYPLRGQLKVTDSEDEAGTEASVTHGPSPGEVWVEPRVLSVLHLQLGAKLTVGEKVLTISRILRYEPDKRGDFYSFSPRVILHQLDLAATGVIQPGSHVHYFYQFTGSEASLAALRAFMQPLLNPSQRIMDIHQDRPELGGALQRAERYLGLSSIVVILIAGVAIAMATQRYTERHFNATALLRCLGCRQAEILQLYLLQFLLLGMLGSGLGCLLGWLGQAGLFYWLREFLPASLAGPGGWALLLGWLTGMAILLGFALPPLLRLRRVSPLRVLRRELEPLPAQGWLVHGLAIALVAVLIWRYTNDWRMTTSLLGSGMLVLLILGLLIHGLLRLLARQLPGCRLSWRFALQGLVRNGQASISQILAFVITLAAMVLSFSVRSDLIESWRQQMPDKAPNHFALNIFPDRLGDFQQDLRTAAIDSSRFYPVIKGRLVAINDEPVNRRVSKDSQGESATQRELSLTWSDTLPADNVVSEGQAWPAGQTGWVSVEKKLADNLAIHVGDRLMFTVGGAQLTARVSSLRSLQWETMRPNFYMIFSPGTLDGFPTTYMTSFYWPDEQKSALHALVKKYPATTVLDVEQILKQFKTILDQLTRAIDVVLYFALLAGFVVLLAAVYATLDQRLYQGALLRTLGAGKSWLRWTHVIEFASLGALAGLLAVALSQVVLYVLYSRVMHYEFHPAVWLWLLLPVGASFVIGLAGFWGLRSVVRQSPLQVLRRC